MRAEHDACGIGDRDHSTQTDPQPPTRVLHDRDGSCITRIGRIDEVVERAFPRRGDDLAADPRLPAPTGSTSAHVALRVDGYVTDLPRDVAPGEEAVLFGKQGDHEITVNEVAAWAGTITSDILTRLGKRVVQEHRNS